MFTKADWKSSISWKFWCIAIFYTQTFKTIRFQKYLSPQIINIHFLIDNNIYKRTPGGRDWLTFLVKNKLHLNTPCLIKYTCKNWQIENINLNILLWRKKLLHNNFISLDEVCGSEPWISQGSQAIHKDMCMGYNSRRSLTLHQHFLVI